MHVIGTLNYNNRNTYNGEWKNGEKNGKIKTNFANKGDCCDGDYLDNTRHGFGTYFSMNESKYVRYWINGKRNGKGVFETNEGTNEEEYLEDKKYGKGIYYLKNETQLSVNWEIENKLKIKDS